jgi:hypothetical protein
VIRRPGGARALGHAGLAAQHQAVDLLLQLDDAQDDLERLGALLLEDRLARGVVLDLDEVLDLELAALSSFESLRISLSVMSARNSAAMTWRSPSSMRLAIVTSPSRVSSGTLPISRRYMRTGSS